jgi:glucan phosphoethanolaminetransferase (alkaline phosphatase superfamily)
MPTDRAQAWGEFRRMLVWIALAGVLMVAGALWYLAINDSLYLSAILATIGGVFLSTLLGCGLFAAAFFSDKSGHDANVSSATHHEEPAD